VTRGEIWLVNLDPTMGREIGKVETHRTQILQKLGLYSVPELIL
jgi:mRNA-degrading endonuclease toxin of MazEF toxin-antitoxin module